MVREIRKREWWGSEKVSGKREEKMRRYQIKEQRESTF